MLFFQVSLETMICQQFHDYEPNHTSFFTRVPMYAEHSDHSHHGIIKKKQHCHTVINGGHQSGE
jgi:hypothetical protein